MKISSTKAAILVEQKPLVIDTVELPEYLKVGQILVKVETSGICGSQIGEIEGVKGEDRFIPHLMGHEASAIVIEIGEGVNKVSPGDKVILHWRKSKGIQSEPPIYKWNGKFNAGWVTTFNEYAQLAKIDALKLIIKFLQKLQLFWVRRNYRIWGY